MNAFDTKSRNSKKAAMKLFKAKLYCNSIQSFYYSLLQKSKGAIIKSGVDEKTLEESLNLKEDGKTNDTHKKIITWTAAIIKNAGGKGAKYSKDISDIKRKRTHYIYGSEMADVNIATVIRDKHKIISNYIEGEE